MEELMAGSEKEWTEEEKDEMRSIDEDGDQKLSREELLSYISKELEERESAQPTDDEEEPESNEKIVDTFFETQDLDKDGVISYDEFISKHDEL